MSDHHHHRHARLNRLRTTPQLLRKATSSFTSHPITFLFLTLLLFSFRCFVDHCSLLLASFIDRDPSLRSLLSRLPLHPPQSRRGHPPFLHLTRVSTLDDEFFSTEDEDPHRRSFHGFSLRSPVNATTVILSGLDVNSGFPYPVVDNGLLFRQIIHPGVVFRYLSPDEDGVETEANYDKPGRDRESDEHHDEKNQKKLESTEDLRLFTKGLELGRHDGATLFFLVSFLSAAYGWVILGFTTVYSLVLGILFITVVNDLIGRFCSFVEVVWSGSRLGLKRVTGFILMRWAVRDALAQLLGLWYFGEVEDQFSFFRLFVRLKLMPFTLTPPWFRGFEKEISGFLFTWFLLDAFIGLIFAVDAYIAIVDSRRRGREIVEEGLYLISILLNQALQIRCLEALLCGLFARWVLVRAFGKGFAAIFQSAVEVYFMVTWMIFYLAARCKDAHMEGRRFGRRELEGLIDGFR